jgi:hypothetical protein
MLFKTYDPRGYAIICDKARWDNHIINEHDVMVPDVESVKNTVENPCAIYQSSTYTNRDVYFCKVPTSTYYPLYTKVVVEIDNNKKKGIVVSSWPQKTISGGIVSDFEGLKYVKSQL